MGGERRWCECDGEGDGEEGGLGMAGEVLWCISIDAGRGIERGSECADVERDVEALQPD